MAERPGVILSLRGLTKKFAGHAAVDAIDLDIHEGELFTIVGPSGSGKTTLLRMLAGMETPTSGDILLRGKRINT
ncbi:MAG: ATP-binding cassette domain-containing protein, partial [Bauldia sp.]|nr:ATP-binding cassette domain-containing protein [Bauldia sp.]